MLTMFLSYIATYTFSATGLPNKPSGLKISTKINMENAKTSLYSAPNMPPVNN